MGAMGGCAVRGGFSGSLQQAERLREQKEEGKSGAGGTQKGRVGAGRRKQGEDSI